MRFLGHDIYKGKKKKIMNIGNEITPETRNNVLLRNGKFFSNDTLKYLDLV